MGLELFVLLYWKAEMLNFPTISCFKKEYIRISTFSLF